VDVKNPHAGGTGAFRDEYREKDLADAVGVSRPYISMIENGERAVTKRDLLLRLAHAIGVSVNDLTAQPFEPVGREELALYLAAPRIRLGLAGE
jgi:transcriptional regulator with XRE-family HTH domain